MIVLAVLVGCTPAEYARQADHDAYRVVDQSRRFALESQASPGDVGAGAFNVGYRPLSTTRPTTQPSDLGAIQLNGRIIPLSAEEPEVLTLDECLNIAVRNSRSFQTRKETLYSLALALANTRRGWNSMLLGGDVTGEASRWRENGFSGTNEGAAAVGPTLTQYLVDGGVLTLASTVDLATDFLGMDGTTIGGLLEANFTQPLLRGAWNTFAYETQYRLERDFVFSVFDYERFTQTFIVSIIRDYYAVLQLRDRLQNQRATIERRLQTVKVTRVLVDGGQVSRIELDQAEQDYIDSQVTLETQLQVYHDALDAFKITLGLPVRANVVLAYPNELISLNLAGPKDVPFSEDRAVAVAFTTRPDVLTERAKVRDARRDVEIAANQFLPQLDVEVGISAANSGQRDFYDINFRRHTRTAGVVFDYQLDQTDNRDAYRNALIAADKVERDYSRFTDEVRLEVRRSYRVLARSRRNYELQSRNVAIAQRRTKLAALQQKEGLASARDVLEAEQGLLNAQNGLTNALISYTTARYDFLAGLGMLWVDEKGQLHERAKPFTFEPIQKRYDYLGGQNN